MSALTTPEFWNRKYGTSGSRGYPSWLSRGDAELMTRMSKFLPAFAGGDILEIGCGNSYWLPYFFRRYGMHVSGIDFSVERLSQARINLHRSGVRFDEINLLRADIMDRPDLGKRFDIVCSFGVIEHFSDPSQVLKIFSGYLKPGGVIITTVPTLKGFLGRVCRKINSEVVSGYLELNSQDVIRLHECAGMEVLYEDHFRWLDLAVANYSLLPRVAQLAAYGFVTLLNFAVRFVPGCLSSLFPPGSFADLIIVSRKKNA